MQHLSVCYELVDLYPTEGDFAEKCSSCRTKHFAIALNKTLLT